MFLHFKLNENALCAAKTIRAKFRNLIFFSERILQFFNSATPGSFLSVGVKLFELAAHKTYRKERDNSVVIRGMGKGLEIASIL